MAESLNRLPPAERPLAADGGIAHRPERVRNGGRLAALRTQVLYKALDAVLTTPLRPPAPLGEALRAGTAHYARVGALVGLLDRLRPGLAQALSRALMRTGQLPLAHQQVELLGYGSGATAYLVEHEAGRAVLKVYRRSLGQPPIGLARIAQEFQTKYKTVAGWYNGRHDLVPPAVVLILAGPLAGLSAVALLQPYVAGPRRDLFLDFSDDELCALFGREPTLRDEFLAFAGRTLRVYRQEGRCVDFVGRENVVVVGDDRPRLRVLDNGIFNLAALAESAPGTAALVTQRLSRLQQLQSRVEGDGSC